MKNNVRQIFNMLGVEPNEIFRVDGHDYKYYIDDNLEVYAISYNPYIIINYPKILIEVINNPERIIKLPKTKKLRDLTSEDWRKWKEKKCPQSNCRECIFYIVNCDGSYSRACWINNKDLYSDKFLNQEIEVE